MPRTSNAQVGGRTLLRLTAAMTLVLATAACSQAGADWDEADGWDLTGQRSDCPDRSFTAIAAGRNHSLALTPSGCVAAWGSDFWGQVSVPEEALAGVAAIGAGPGASFAIKHDGSLVAWGKYQDVTPPEQARSDVRDVDGERWGPAATLTRQGGVVLWGADEWEGASIGPVPEDAAAGITAVSVTDRSSAFLALTEQGTVLSWDLGSTRLLTEPETARADIRAITSGEEHFLALTSDGHAVEWAPDSTRPSPVPTAATGLVAIAAGDDFSAALTEDGRIVAWGALTPDLLEVPGTVTDGVLITDIPGSPIVDIAAAGNQILALRADGTLYAWGGNGSGETDVPVPAAPS